MAEAAFARPESVERLLRRMESLPLGPLWLGLGVALGGIVVFVGWHAATGVTAPVFSPGEVLHLTADGRAHVVVVLLIGFLVAVHRYESRHWREDAERLQPLTRCSRARFGRILETRGALDRRAQALYVGGAVLVGLLLIPGASPDPAFVLRAEGWDAHLLWAIVSNGLFFGLMGRSVYADLLERRVRAAIVGEIRTIDLLDHRSLAPFARQGLRNAFYWAAGSSIASLLVFNVERTWPILVILAGTIALATAALVSPVLGVHRLLRQEKQQELARVRARIEHAKQAALDAGRRSLDVARLPGLLAYEARIERVSEWPFDTPTLLRFGGLVLLVVGSWLGGALVERMLGAVLD